jgi:hypothetical protein
MPFSASSLQTSRFSSVSENEKRKWLGFFPQSQTPTFPSNLNANTSQPDNKYSSVQAPRTAAPLKVATE